MSTYLEPASRYDRTGGGGGSGVSAVSSLLPPSSVIGSTNPDLFAPAHSPVFNTTDGNTYVFNGSSWILSAASFGQNPDQTVKMGGTNLLEFNELTNGTYLIQKGPAGVSYAPQPLVAYDLTIRVTPTTIGRFRPTLSPGSRISGINGVVATIGSKIGLALNAGYYVLNRNQTITFNPMEYYDRLAPGDEIAIITPYEVTDGINTSTGNLTAIVERPMAVLAEYNSLQNWIFKLNYSSALSSYELALVVKGTQPISGTSSQLTRRSTGITIPVGVINELSCLSYNAGDGRVYLMKRESATARGLYVSSMASDGSFGITQFLDESRLSVGNVGSPVDRFTSAGCIDQKRGIGFFVNTLASGTVDYAAVVTMPGYVPNSIPGIYTSGQVVRVRTNSTGGSNTLDSIFRDAIAWSPLRDRFYSICPVGLPTNNGVGTTLGAAGTLLLVEHTLNYSTYNPLDPQPYVGHSVNIMTITIPVGQVPLNRGQFAIALCVDGFGNLLAMSRDVSGTSALVYTLDLTYLPSLPAVNASFKLINGVATTTFNISNHITCNQLAPSIMESPDITLGDDFPLTGSDLYNNYTEYSLSVGTPVLVSENASNVVHTPRSLAGTPAIRALYVEYVAYPGSTVTTPSIPPGIVLTSTNFGSRVRHVFRGAATDLVYETLLGSLVYQTSHQTDFDHEIEVWVEAINGAVSPKRKAFVTIRP